MLKHPIKIERIAYSDARSLIRVGDGIGCRGNRPVSRLIRLWRGGMYDLSHWATVIRDLEIGADKRIRVFEYTGGGNGHIDLLSERYAKEHGTVLWVPMHCTCDQQDSMIELAADLEGRNVKYDFGTTWMAIFTTVLSLDEEEFNCSESAWFLTTRSGRCAKRYDAKGKEIAPVPGDFPLWAGAQAIYELDMSR